MSWTTSQNSLPTPEERSTTLWKPEKCHLLLHLFKRLVKRISAMQRVIGNQTIMRSMTTNSVNIAPSQRGLNGVSIARPTVQREATSTLNTQSPWAHMVKTREINWMQTQKEQTISIMNWLWERQRQPHIFQVTMDSFPRLISIHRQLVNLSSEETEKLSSNRTSLRTIKSNCQVTQATSQWTR